MKEDPLEKNNSCIKIHILFYYLLAQFKLDYQLLAADPNP